MFKPGERVNIPILDGYVRNLWFARRDNYMVIRNSFDRSTGFFHRYIVVIGCTNQFSRIQGTQTIRHNKQIKMKLDEFVSI